jgi:hypothetical protein
VVSIFDSGENVLQICLKADERDVYEFFSRAGKVSSVAITYTAVLFGANTFCSLVLLLTIMHNL